jgi:glutaminyl-peptide cyclotransferase
VLRLALKTLFVHAACLVGLAGIVCGSVHAAPLIDYVVVEIFPHDPQAFTQGLVYHDGFLYESTGLLGKSSVRQVDPKSGAIIRSVDNASDIFGEGLTLLHGRLYQLTWKNHRVLVYDADTLQLLEELPLPTQGWGVTHDGARLIVSDGSSTIYLRDPETLAEIDRLTITEDSRPITLLNELEYIDGFLFANQWQSNFLYKIDLDTGQVVGRYDLSELADQVSGELESPTQDVLNGIAWDQPGRRLLVTGKRWPKLFVLSLR